MTPARPLRRTLLLAATLVWLAAGPRLAPARGADDPSVAVRARLVGLLGPREHAEFDFLEHLGWRVVASSAVRGVEAQGGTPCARADLASSRGAGDLQILVSPSASEAELRAFAQTLPALADSVATRCAYMLHLSAALERATTKLVASIEDDRYTFPKVFLIDSPWWRLRPCVDDWVRRSETKTWVPKASVSAAIEAFYDKKCVTECYAGQLVAMWATQYELYGGEAFDHAFLPEEIVLGRPTNVEDVPFGWSHPSPGYHDRRVLFIEGADQDKDASLVLGKLGPKAFSGLTGVLLDQADRQYCNENFLLVRINQAAVDELVANGGFDHIGRLTAQALVHHKAEMNLYALAADIKRNREAKEAILANPVFTGIDVWIHPYGVIPLGEVVWDKIRFKISAVSFNTYRTGREHAFYRRYHLYFVDRWLATQGQAATVAPVVPGRLPEPGARPVPPPPPPPYPLPGGVIGQ